MSSALYTVTDPEGYEIDTDLTLEEAARTVLTHDSREFEIRADDTEWGGYTLWTRSQIRNEPWTPTTVYSGRADRTAATVDIYERVIWEGWRGHPTARICWEAGMFDEYENHRDA